VGGKIGASVSERGVQWLRLLPDSSECDIHAGSLRVGIAGRLDRALQAYFSGQQVDFSSIPLDIQGTSFQHAVWEGARLIRWGTTDTYAGLANRIGCPKAVRAIGQALGTNPVPILVPCHRIVAANGRLGGFSAGLDWKRILLRIEGHTILD